MISRRRSWLGEFLFFVHALILLYTCWLLYNFLWVHVLTHLVFQRADCVCVCGRIVLLFGWVGGGGSSVCNLCAPSFALTMYLHFAL